jgi:hypothetical protein
MNQLDQMTHENSSATQQTASAANLLSSQANTLRSAVTQLMSTVQGNQHSEAGERQGLEKTASTHGQVIQLKRQTASSPLKTAATNVKSESSISQVPAETDSRFREA